MRCGGLGCSLCFLIISVWGVIMLLLLGIFARVNAVALSEDLPLDKELWAKEGFSEHIVNNAYILMSTNCFIAAGIYGLIAIFSGVGYYFYQRKDYMIH